MFKDETFTIVTGQTGNQPDGVNGAPNDDVLFGGNGTDVLLAGDGDDNLFGQGGTDELNGGAGADSLDGGGGADTFTIGNSDSGITLATADTINDFGDGADKLKLGLAGDTTGGDVNYVEAGAAVADFAAALTAANTALAALNGTSTAIELYAFQFDATNGYLFDDVNSDGIADQVIVLTGINNTEIAATDIIV